MRYLIVLFFFVISCKQDISKVSQQKIVFESNNDVYTSLKLNCIDNDGIIESCQYNNELKIKIDYNLGPNKINFEINKQNFIYNTGFIFEGVGSNMFLYQKNSEKILILEYGYEYSSKLLVFQIENNNVFFIQELEFDTPDSKYYYQIGKDSQYMYITLNSEEKEIKRINVNYVNKKAIEKIEDLSKHSMITQKLNWDGIYWLYPYNIDSEKQGNYYINISKDNNEFGFSGDIQFSYKINYKSTDNKLYIFDNNQSAVDPLAVIYKEKDKYYIKSDLIKMERTDLKETKNGYPIRWAKSSDDVPDSPSN